jgi:hypothetical protein
MSKALLEGIALSRGAPSGRTREEKTMAPVYVMLITIFM